MTEARTLTPSPKEQQRARSGYYKKFSDMPRIVREWAKQEGCAEGPNGVNGYIRPINVIEDAVRECLSRNGSKKKK